MFKELTFRAIIITLLFITALAACSKLAPASPKDNELLDGPLEGLTTDQMQIHIKGDQAFNDDVFTMANGLGPIFVASSCGSCHAGDGKGHPFSTLTRFGQSDSNGNTYLNQGGPQLQHRAIPGYMPEQIPNGASFSKFLPPANTGLGYLELVSDADLIAMSDPNDINGDKISGVPNWKTLPNYITPFKNAIENNTRYIHRFGKKAAAYNLLHQTVNAYNQDMGITSIYEPKDTYSGLAIAPEVSNTTLNDVVFYLQTLKSPIPRNVNDEKVIAGKNKFISIGCENCHKQTLRTGYSPIDALSFKDFHPYTDLLLHDMGKNLDDGYTEGSALTSEWRTPPLWGLGLSPNSQGGQYFLLHDGRAHTIEEAILLHGGEASPCIDAYKNLSPSEKETILKFLQSL